MKLPPELMRRVTSRGEFRGMQRDWHIGVHGLLTVGRVPPPELYESEITDDRELTPGEVFDRIVKGEYAKGYQRG